MPATVTPPASTNVLPMQPKPVGLILDTVEGVAGPQTVIVREWAEGAARRCRLCPAGMCNVTARGTCLVVAPVVVAPTAAALYRLPGQGLPGLGVVDHAD